MPDTTLISDPVAAGDCIQLELRGMHCAGCAGAVERALLRVPGVARASVNLATARASVWIADHRQAPSPLQLVDAVQAAGYQARVLSGGRSGPPPASQRQAQLPQRWLRLALAVGAGLPVITLHLLAPRAVHWVLLTALTAAVFAIAGGPMMTGAFRALLARRANMDVLVSLGAVTAFVSSLIGVLLHAHELVAFDAAVMIVLFVSLGKHIETRARRHASAALQSLMSCLPRTALRVTSAGTENVPLESVGLGDRIRVAAGMIVPVDGDIVSGRASVNEALLTGEALPVERGVSQRVLGGSEVTDGLVEIRATATGSTCAAARIAALVEQAQAIKPPWQRFADRVAAAFVPTVLVLALATFLGWKWLAAADTAWALQRMIAVLVVACPCALGLAIPTAVLVGSTRAAEHGILIRDPAALEAAGQVREVVFDKTGTLTLGLPALVRVVPCEVSDESAVLASAAALEQFSPHPLARALVTAAQARGLALVAASDLRSRPGGGLSGTVAGARVVVGSADWLQDSGVPTTAYQSREQTLVAEGYSVVWVGIEGCVAALLAFADTVHPEAEPALAMLRVLGVRVRILSGDRRAAVRSLADRLGIEKYEAELSPEQKLQRIRELVAGKRGVAMVGDGINDAPALAAADVGIAIGTGADVARQAATICLVGHSPRLVAEAIRISRASARIMRQNLFWALIYNLVMLPAAMITPLPPALATAAMMCSSLSVVGNALRLRRAI